jgi:hypothetical protein
VQTGTPTTVRHRTRDQVRSLLGSRIDGIRKHIDEDLCDLLNIDVA